jgi:uncharacterized protein YciI
MKTLFVVTRVRGKAWDADKSMRSQDQWAEHAVFMDELAASGFVVLGGPVGEDGDVLLVVDAAFEEEIRPTLERDPWSQSGILEVASIQRWIILLKGADEASGG